MPNTSLNAMQPSPDMTPDPNAPDFGGDLFEYKPAYGQAAPLTAGFSAETGSQYQGSPLAAPTLNAMPAGASPLAPQMPGTAVNNTQTMPTAMQQGRALPQLQSVQQGLPTAGGMGFTANAPTMNMPGEASRLQEM